MTQQPIVKCPRCGADMKLIPAGISKKGHPYDAFYSCKQCGYTMPASSGTAKKSYQARTYSKGFQKAVAKPMSPEEKARLEKLHKERIDNIAWTNALNNAVELVANHPAFKDLDEQALLNEINNIRLTFFTQTKHIPNYDNTEPAEENEPDEKLKDISF